MRLPRYKRVEASDNGKGSTHVIPSAIFQLSFKVNFGNNSRIIMRSVYFVNACE